jgi:hypothetical protein
MVPRDSGETRKYEVIRAPGGWAVERAGERIGAFVAPEPAIEQACLAARADAVEGRLAIVTTQTTPQEFHCYSPPDRASAASQGYPRLAFSR